MDSPQVRAGRPVRRSGTNYAELRSGTPAADFPAIHLHAVVQGAALWRDHLAFRDALRSDRSLAGEYAALERHLAVLHADDRAAYTDAKGPFITRVLARRHATRPST